MSSALLRRAVMGCVHARCCDWWRRFSRLPLTQFRTIGLGFSVRTWLHWREVRRQWAQSSEMSFEMRDGSGTRYEVKKMLPSSSESWKRMASMLPASGVKMGVSLPSRSKSLSHVGEGIGAFAYTTAGFVGGAVWSYLVIYGRTIRG